MLFKILIICLVVSTLIHIVVSTYRAFNRPPPKIEPRESLTDAWAQYYHESGYFDRGNKK